MAKSLTGDWTAAGPLPASLEKVRQASKNEFDPHEGRDAEGKSRFDPGVTPQLHIWVENKAPWFTITDTLPQKPKGPGS